MEEESFNDVMGHAPVYSSGLPGVSVTNPAEFKEWHGRVRRAHEREVAVGVAAMTNAQLAEHGLYRIGSAAMWDEVRDTKDRELSEEHGLVRLPVDADGVCWTGDETEHYAPNGDSIPALGLLYHHGEWFVTDRDGAYLAKECHHTKPADTPASLADELEAWCDAVDVDGDACDKPRALAERIRRLAAKKDE